MITLTIRDKSGEPTQVEVKGQVHMINYNKLLKTLKPKMRETILRLFPHEKLCELGLGDPMISLTEIEAKVSFDAKQEEEDEKKEKDEADIDLLANMVDDLLLAPVGKEKPVQEIIAALDIMSDSEFYKFISSNIEISVNFTAQAFALDVAAGKKDFAEVKKITVSLFRKQKKLRQVDYLLAYFIGKGANLILHHLCSKVTMWEDSEEFKNFCKETFDRSPGTIYKRYIRFYKFVTNHQLFLKVSNLGFDRCVNLISKFTNYFALEFVGERSSSSVQRDEDRKKFLSFKFDMKKVRK